jgi:Uma2 family endonuclease
MSPNLPRAIQALAYEREAQAYLRSLPPEHFMEATPQAMQRKITLESLDLVAARRPDFHVFNELLVQYPRKRQRKPGQVVPDNLVVLTKEPIRASSSYNVPLEPAPPFWVLEYVSKESQRKDYEDSFKKYERELKVPYYLTFFPDNQEMTLYRHNRRRYVTVKPNQHDRYEIPELDLEIGLVGGFVHFWYEGKLLPLPAELQRALDEASQRADKEKLRADAEKQRADKEKLRADAEKQRADKEKLRADTEKQRADELQEKLARRMQAMERDLAALRSRLGEND